MHISLPIYSYTYGYVDRWCFSNLDFIYFSLSRVKFKYTSNTLIVFICLKSITTT